MTQTSFHQALAFAALVGATACASPQEPALEPAAPAPQAAADPTGAPAIAEQAPPPGEATPADDAPADPAADDVPAEPAATGAPAATVVVESDQQGPTGPAQGPVTLTASPQLNAIRVDIANLTTYCAPAPAFTATVDGQMLRLALTRPATPSRCFAPHTLRLRVDLPGRNNVRRVVLADDRGAELASAPVASGTTRSGMAPDRSAPPRG